MCAVHADTCGSVRVCGVYAKIDKRIIKTEVVKRERDLIRCYDFYDLLKGQGEEHRHPGDDGSSL